MIIRHILLWIFISTSTIFLNTPTQAQNDSPELLKCIKKVKRAGYVDLHAQFICEGQNERRKHDQNNAMCILERNNRLKYKVQTNEAITYCHPTFEMQNPDEANKCKDKIKKANIPRSYKPFFCEYPYIQEHPESFVQCTIVGVAQRLPVLDKLHFCVEIPMQMQEKIAKQEQHPTPTTPAAPKTPITIPAAIPTATPRPDLGTKPDASPPAAPDGSTPVKTKPDASPPSNTDAGGAPKVP